MRITPARAGTASRPRPPPTEKGDHPRSRGDGLARNGRVGDVFGSPPLARGRRCRSTRPDLPTGITPARAGTAARRWRSGGVGRDHPRSRGDGTTMSTTPTADEGSPPLARGRPTADEADGQVDRITPARAGTAARRWRSGGVGRDHPRSRGDGFTVQVKAGARRGSPPLARGRRISRPPVGSRPGITPARAGTAGRTTTGRTRPWDHPRSRGDGLVVVPGEVGL